MYPDVIVAAPIVPGETAAGFVLGQPAGHALSASPISFTVEKRGRTFCHRSDFVDIWEDKEIISQIGVHGCYKGKVRECVGIGDSLNDIERLLGPVGENDEDSLVVKGIPGLCVEITIGRFLGPSRSKSWARQVFSAPIERIFVIGTLCSVCDYDLRSSPEMDRCPKCNRLLFEPLR